MMLCSIVPSSAYLLDGLGGILAQSATEPGQLMTRFAVEPPTMSECCIEDSFTFGGAHITLPMQVVK